MPYIYIERKEGEPSRNTRFKCTLCNFEIPSNSWKENISVMITHTRAIHPIEWKKIALQKQNYDIELAEFEKMLNEKYPEHEKTEGVFFKSLPLPPKRMWKCPDCGSIMSSHDKYYHEQNSYRDYICKRRR
jgi:transposase-like protein